MKIFNPKKCIKCNLDFTPNSSTAKICQDCKTYSCKNCNKSFVITKIRDSQHIKYCSKKCLYEGRNTQVNHICEKCNNKFISKSTNSKWCIDCRTCTCLICQKPYILKPRLVKISKYCSKVCKHKGDMNYIWKEEDFEYIKKNYPLKKSLEEIAIKFNTSISAVARLKHKLNLLDCPIELRQRRVGDKQMVWTKEKIIEKIKEIYSLGLPISSSYIQKNYQVIHTAAYKRFGNWEKAITQAGFNYHEVNLYSNRITWNTEKIITRILELHKMNESLMASDVRDNHTNLFLAVRRDNNIGSWQKAVELAGLDYKEICSSRWGQKYIGKDGIQYNSIIEGKVGDILYNLLLNNKIQDYFTQVKLTDKRRWTCDFLVILNSMKNESLWLEVDGLEESRKDGVYNENHEKIKYFIDNNLNFKVIINPNDVIKIIEKETITLKMIDEN